MLNTLRSFCRTGLSRLGARSCDVVDAAEHAERRRDARVAREVEVALPHELSAAQRLALTREFAAALAEKYGVAIDFAIHSPHGDTDERNYHAHLLLTTRVVTSEGLRGKAALELENKALAAAGAPNTIVQIAALRAGWEQAANVHLARAGHGSRSTPDRTRRVA